MTKLLWCFRRSLRCGNAALDSSASRAFLVLGAAQVTPARFERGRRERIVQIEDSAASLRTYGAPALNDYLRKYAWHNHQNRSARIC